MEAKWNVTEALRAERLREFKKAEGEKMSKYGGVVVMFIFILAVFLTVATAPNRGSAEDEKIDASDPTKIYTYAGGGLKYTDYTNGENMWELRATGNVGLSESDMVLFELGYGWHSGNKVPGSNSGLTNGRARWFHLFPMDNMVVSGYRGMGTQVDLQLAGDLKGTDGQNTLALGWLGAFSISEDWKFYLPVNFANTWDKRFERWNGAGLGVAPLFVYSPANWWKGAYLQIWPTYTYFFTGELEGDGSGNLDLIAGGEITSTLLWSVTFQQNFDVDLNTFRRGRDTGLKNDWNIFANVTTYF